MDPVEQKFAEMTWPYAEGDPIALGRLEDRIAATGRKRTTITYSDLVRGIPFNLANLRESPRVVDVSAWQELDRAIVGDFLGYISMRSYKRGGFFASALAVMKGDGTASEGFYHLLAELGLIPDRKSERGLALWVDHVERAHRWFSGPGR